LGDGIKLHRTRYLTQCRIKGGRELHASDLAGWISLSEESRARHLFKEQAGVSFKRYLKWLKTMEAVKYTCTANSNLTEAAHMAGFSDSAHLSRTFKEMFGLSPSSIFK
jgi:AraC-like DNA-binding protein